MSTRVKVDAQSLFTAPRSSRLSASFTAHKPSPRKLQADETHSPTSLMATAAGFHLPRRWRGNKSHRSKARRFARERPRGGVPHGAHDLQDERWRRLTRHCAALVGYRLSVRRGTFPAGAAPYDKD